jgi:hypothetical protein
VGGREFRAYPEQIHDRWAPQWSTGTGENKKTYNEDRDSVELPASWNGIAPPSRRNPGLHCRIRPLSDNIKKDILATATSREDFHDYDKIHAEGNDCLCELRIITGKDCEKHLKKDGKTGQTENLGSNRHWGWYIDIAPRGYLCPAVWRRRNRLAVDVGYEGCSILIEPPSEEWVLAQLPGDPEGTCAGRAVGDEVRLGVCCACAGSAMRDNHEIRVEQLSKFKYLGETKWFIQPVEYRPMEPNCLRHPLLELNSRYDQWYLLHFRESTPRVSARDIWLPHVTYWDDRYSQNHNKAKERKGCRLETWQKALSHVDAGTPDQETERFALEALRIMYKLWREHKEIVDSGGTLTAAQQTKLNELTKLFGDHQRSI